MRRRWAVGGLLLGLAVSGAVPAFEGHDRSASQPLPEDTGWGWRMADRGPGSRHPELEQRFEAGQIGAAQLEALGRLNETGYLDGRVDLREAALWYRRAVEAGASTAAVRLGWLWLQATGEGEALASSGMDAEGRDRDRSETLVRRAEAERRAEYWFARAAALGDASGKTALASLWVIQALDRGPGALGDTALNAEALRNGSPDAESNEQPEMQSRIEPAWVRSMSEALSLLGEAVEAGHAEAAVLLARIHLEGLAGQAPDPVRGAAAAEAGAQLGNVLLQGWTAGLYAEGIGVAPDPVRAYAWALLAAAEGDELGRQLRSRLSAELDAVARQEALEMASGWVLHAATVDRLPMGLRDGGLRDGGLRDGPGTSPMP